MANIKNTTKGDIRVHTEAGDFVFKAGETLELADERAAMVIDKGAVYFTVGELVADAEISALKTDEASESVADDAIKSVAEDATNEEKPAEKPAPAAVKAVVKPAPAAKK